MKKALILIPLFGFNIVSAQLPSADRWTHLEFESRFLSHIMPLKLLNTDSVSLGNSSLSYFKQNSAFRDVYTPSVSEGFKIDSKRYVSVNDWKFYGQFSFSKYQDRGSRFTALADPYRDNPYKIADSVTNASWNKQHYLLEARILTPEITRNIRSGLGIKYEVLNGARQIDPRPSDKLINLELTPQLIYSLKQWDMGVYGYYNRFREDLNISLENNQLPKNIYKMLGLGEYLYNGPVILSGGLSRFYEGNTYGAGLSVSNKISSSGFIQLSGHIKTTGEQATDGISVPFNAGHHRSDEKGGTLTYEITISQARHMLSLEASRLKSENTEFIQFLNDVTLQYEVLHSAVMHEQTNNRAALDYSVLLINRNQSVSWNFGLNAAFQHRNEVYRSTSSHLKWNNYLISAYARKWIHLKPFNITIGYRTSFKKAGNHELQFIPNPKTSNFVATQILYPNYYFNTTDAWTHKAELQVTLPAFEKRRSQLYFRADSENTSSIGNSTVYPDQLSNHFFNITVGLYN